MKTALIILDMQDAILGNLKNVDSLTQNIANVISTARQNQVLVIHVRAGFRKGVPEISNNNKFLSASKSWFENSDPEQFLKIHDNLMSKENDITIDRRRMSAFTGSDLEIILRANDIQNIVLAGVGTSGSVLSTVREASDKDYIITVLSNGCADNNEDKHHFLLTQIFPSQAEVQTIDEWKTTIK